MTPSPIELTNYPQLFDGFCYSNLFGMRPNNRLNWYWACLGNMETLRVAADSYRPRQWVIPPNFIDPTKTNSANIEPGKTFFYEFQVKEGSILWGMQFSARVPSTEDFDLSNSNTKFSVVVRQGSDLAFADRPQVASGIYQGNSADPFNILKPPVDLIPMPRLIIPPAQLNVEVSNDADPDDDNFAVSCQLILLFAEPKG